MAVRFLKAMPAPDPKIAGCELAAYPDLDRVAA